jgi:hypothetical protein
MGTSYLNTPIDPLPDDMRSAKGIAQTDIILRTALLAGLDDLRANPTLLDYVFSSLPKDALTYKQYGEQQVTLAKDWFLSQDIPVFMNTRMDDSKIPCITIAMTGSSEAEATLGDINYQTSEAAIGSTTIVYAGPFTPVKYDTITGYMTLPSSLTADLFPGMAIRDGNGVKHTIIDIIDTSIIELAPNLNVDFTGSYLISNRSVLASIEGLEFRETFEIGCHVLSEPVYLTYLHSIVVFILLRYKEELLEGRGLERTTVASGPVTLNTSFGITEPVFTRMVNLTGFVRQYWPKFIRNPVEGMEVTVNVETTADFYTLRRGTIPAAYPSIIAGGT